ncbi:alpha/beta fold hydrolase [Desulfobotulus sp.]|uniref:alpha/beta hydrolase family protein n=1 Tax=Desulfobotulus sp. TaxID=1940337 RepID=UPI002A36EE66|nr:alpha/beta fold hydrolase [Desulfobotulus sp.]MDY0162445.1 alpha/beta fold hydrolase [Desulfobotulus sp.]
MTMTSKDKGVPFPLSALDGYPLAATRFEAEGPVKGHMVVAGATGVPQDFYRRFACHASRQGFTVLTLDYRGIGKSRPANLKGFEAGCLDWGRLDLAAAVGAMAAADQPLFLVGHSYGGHALGLLPNHELLTACCTLGAGAGWHGWMPFAESLRVRFLWNVVLPPLTRWKGYCPFAMLGMGEDLPLGVYEQWRHWCRFPHYFFDDPEMPHMKALYAEVRTPLLGISALDDLWALPVSRDAFMQGYSGARLTRMDLDPKVEAWGSIGHMGYFRDRAWPLWDRILAWFGNEGQMAEKTRIHNQNPALPLG